MKKTILLDLDGVLNTYNGNYIENFIPPMREGAKDFVINLSRNYNIKLYTTRNKNLARKWLSENDLLNHITDVTNVKELAWLFIDDRCIKFTGKYDNLLNDIENFQPWYK